MLFHDYVTEKKFGQIFSLRVAFRLDDRNGPEPDIAFVSNNRLHLVQRRQVEGAPDLAVEIVSSESGERDYKKKRRQYQRAGVREYWIVDPLKKRMTLLRLSRDGNYREI